MREFFKGWRRKAGVVLLMLAIAFTVGWARSSFITDEIDLGCSRQIDVQVGSHQGTLFAIVRDTSSSPFAIRSRRHHSIRPMGDPIDWSEGNYYTSDRDLQWCGFRFAKVTGYQEPPDEFDFWAISYLSIVLPLTLISAFLILWKPRKAK